jgi:hypothetical protein
MSRGATAMSTLQSYFAMPKVLTNARIVSYRANGYLYPIDALTPAEVEHYRTALLRT